MNIPGKLREDLKRIYGANDPLHYVEDIKAVTNPDTCQEELVVRLRVPSRYEKYIPEVYITSASPLNLDHWAIQQTRMMDDISTSMRPVKLSAKEVEDIRKIVEGPCHHTFSGGIKKGESSKKKDTIDFAKPERILFSGPYTHVFWPDGSKTSVRLGECDEHDEYNAFCAAIVKKLFGATHKAKKFLEGAKVIQKPKIKKGEPIPTEGHVMEEAPAPEVVEPEMVPMPGTTDPDWGEKHWGDCVAAEAEEVPDNAE